MRYDTWPPASEAPEEGDQSWVKLERTTSIWEVQRQITGISTAQATFSVIASLMGASILALPFAIATTGWLFVPVLALITSACCYTARLLVVLVNEVQPAAGDYRQAQQQHGMSTVSTYENLAETILGRAGLVFTSGVIFVELYGVGVGYLILLGANLHRVFPAVSAAQFTVVSAAALYPSLLVGFEALSNFSSLGLVSAVVVTASVFQAAWAVVASTAAEVHNNSGEEAALGGGGGYGEIGSSGGNGESGGSDGLGVWSGALNELLADHTSLFVPSGMGASCGIALFSFASHAIVPEIYASTKDKRSVCLWCFSLARFECSRSYERRAPLSTHPIFALSLQSPLPPFLNLLCIFLLSLPLSLLLVLTWYGDGCAQVFSQGPRLRFRHRLGAFYRHRELRLPRLWRLGRPAVHSRLEWRGGPGGVPGHQRQRRARVWPLCRLPVQAP
jgi:hypothetical protein